VDARQNGIHDFGLSTKLPTSFSANTASLLSSAAPSLLKEGLHGNFDED